MFSLKQVLKVKELCQISTVLKRFLENRKEIENSNYIFKIISSFKPVEAKSERAQRELSWCQSITTSNSSGSSMLLQIGFFEVAFGLRGLVNKNYANLRQYQVTENGIVLGIL
jgi:hypothetical protein